jgi:hypothetical protein
MNQSDEIAGPIAKIITAWALIGVTSWAQAASFMAFLYSFALVCEWTFKKIIKPLYLYVKGSK